MARETKSARETRIRRGIVPITTWEEAQVISNALRMYAATLDVHDRAYPSPEMREAAVVAAEFADHFSAANVGRAFMEGEES